MLGGTAKEEFSHQSDDTFISGSGRGVTYLEP